MYFLSFKHFLSFILISRKIYQKRFSPCGWLHPATDGWDPWPRWQPRQRAQKFASNHNQVAHLSEPEDEDHKEFKSMIAVQIGRAHV